MLPAVIAYRPGIHGSALRFFLIYAFLSFMVIFTLPLFLPHDASFCSSACLPPSADFPSTPPGPLLPIYRSGLFRYEDIEAVIY